jgi:CRISPR/Cas system CMR-associated protein Cmr1 (group 7 of RAMP superfamily)
MLNNLIFGLNIFYLNLGNVRLVNKNESNKALRRASPLFISVKELSDKVIAINFFVSLRTSFRNEDSRVVFVRNEEKGKIEVGIKDEDKYTTILRFLRELRRVLG